MRNKLLLLAGAAAITCMASAVAQQSAPVVFATDPGAAHPKYVGDELATGNTAAGVTAAVENPYTANVNGPIVGASAIVERPAYDDTVIETAQLSTPYPTDPMYSITGAQAQPTTVAYNTMAYQPAQASGTFNVVRVQPGDTIFGLARRYGVHPNAIIAENAMVAPYTIFAGQNIRMPSSTSSQGSIQNAQYTTPSQQQPQYQPVARTQTPARGATIYLVQPGNTLYGISKSFGHDVATVAAANRLYAPYTLAIGQQLVIPAGGKMASTYTAPATNTAPMQSAQNRGTTWNRNTYADQPAAMPPSQPYQPEWSNPTPRQTKPVSYAKGDKIGESRFAWPVQGRVIMGFGLGDDGRRNDGINIAAPIGAPIRAVDDGEVVYRGSELEGYGNLLLIRHTDGWVSAYAHTDSMLVQKGQKVRQGQVIAKVGTSGTVGQPQLHFELRHELKPTDPLAALEGRNALALQ